MKSGPQATRVTLGGVTVSANVFRNRENIQSGDLRESSTEEMSVIEFPLGGVTPERQQIAIDEFGFKHEIKRVSHIGHAYRLECEVVRT